MTTQLKPMAQLKPTENEFQAVVLGKRQDLDLSITIEDSNDYKNIIRRAGSGDFSRKKMLDLERYLNQRTDDACPRTET